MKTKTLFIIFIIQCAFVQGQYNYFIAGDTTGIIYCNISDTTLEIPGAYTYDIDINADGTNDFGIKTYYSISPSHETKYIRVLPYGNNQVGYSHFVPIITNEGDTVGFARMGKGLFQGDTINHNILFSSEYVRLISYWNHLVGFFYAVWAAGDYIPVCLMVDNNSDCIFGWIKVSGVSINGITIESFAINIPVYTSIRQTRGGDMLIYPNPASDIVNINANNVMKNIIVYNNMGQKVLKKEIFSSFYKLNASILKSGIYHLQIKTVEGTVSKRIVIK